MLTLFAIPKPFIGHIGVIQRNAVRSWILLNPKPEIILFGKDKGTAEICSEFGLKHIPEVACNEYTTPLLSDLFKKAQSVASQPVLCYVNSDIILLGDFMRLAGKLASFENNWLAIVRRWEIKIEQPLMFEQPHWEEELRAHVRAAGRPPFHGVDCFLFAKGFYKSVAPFAIGRGYWDDWLIWQARKSGASVTDASAVAMTIHQDHAGYNGMASSEMARQIKQNYHLNGGWKFIFHKSVPTHVLRETGIYKVSPIEYFKHIGYRLSSHLVGSTAFLRRRLGLYRWWLSQD